MGNHTPYTALTLTARLKAARGEEEFIVNTQGGLTAKGLDRRSEKVISTVDWHAASRAAEDRICLYHGEAQASAFAAHHRVVMDLRRSHSWEIAMDYDIQQRELAALNPAHDLSGLDTAALTVIATRPAPPATMPQHTFPSPKRALPNDAPMPAPKKKQHSCCFQCGAPGHLPGDCTASTTSHGRPAASIAHSAKSKHTLLAPNGKQFCFNWARGSACSFDSACSNFHGCSLCGESSHGAGTCRPHA
jgi:hypothetical protein